LGDGRGGVRCKLGRLEHNAVAGSHGAGQRCEHQLKGVVPGSNDKDHALRFRLNETASGPGQKRDAPVLPRHPGREMAESVADFAQRKPNLRGVGLMRGFAKIGMQGVLNKVLAGLDGLTQHPKLRAAILQGARGAGTEESALASDDSGEIHNQLGESCPAAYKRVK
jgi:hypothetical protein